MRGLSVCRRGNPPWSPIKRAGTGARPYNDGRPFAATGWHSQPKILVTYVGKGGMGWRKEGGEDSGLLAGSEDEISNFAHRPFAAFFRADMRRESVSRLCDFSPFGGLVKIIGGLQVHPELSGCSQRLGQIQSRISRHVPFALDQLIQTSSGPVEFPGKGRLCRARRLQKLFVKNFPWMKGVSGLFHGLTSILHDSVDLSEDVHSHSLADGFLVFDGDGRIRIGRRDGQTSLFEQRDMLFHAAARPGQAILDGAARASEPVEVRRIEPEEGRVRRGLDDKRILQVNHAPPPDVSSRQPSRSRGRCRSGLPWPHDNLFESIGLYPASNNSESPLSLSPA